MNIKDIVDYLESQITELQNTARKNEELLHEIAEIGRDSRSSNANVIDLRKRFSEVKSDIEKTGENSEIIYHVLTAIQEILQRFESNYLLFHTMFGQMQNAIFSLERDPSFKKIIQDNKGLQI